MSKSHSNTLKIRELAFRHGFYHIGIAKAEFMEEEARHLEIWLNQNRHGKMSYMENHFEKRVDPTKLVPGAKSVISLAYNYYNPTGQSDPDAPKLSMYAFGADYHKVVKDKLFLLLADIRTEVGEVSGRCFVDSAPVLERDWAKRSGLGWVGKNTLLIHPKKGSFFFLAELITDLELEADVPIKDYCGTCTKCIDACPTDAIDESGYVMDGSKCISYLTIELRDEIPERFSNQMENWAFGCDICQQVCPWNRFSNPHSEEKFVPNSEIMSMNASQWHEITEDVFETLFKDSALTRTKFKGLKRNLAFLKKSDPK